MNNKQYLIEAGHSVEVSGSDGETVLWGVVENHVVEDT